MRSEFGLIERLKRKIPRSLQGGDGIGDDAARLPGCGREDLLFTTDILVEGVDFERGAEPERIGRKAVAVNLSDIAAMGGVPSACVIGVGIPRGMPESRIERVYGGMISAARQYRVFLAGGDISRSRVFFISVAMLGTAQKDRAVMRRGARPGDRIGVTGRLGGSILGRHFDFTPRVREGLFLRRRFRPTAMIDISDGLVQDLGHLLTASRVGAAIDLDKVPVSRDAFKLARGRPKAALEHALSDGEDFELIFTVSSARCRRLETAWKRRFPRVPLSWIGETVAGRPVIRWRSMGKKCRGPELRKKGFSHF